MLEKLQRENKLLLEEIYKQEVLIEMSNVRPMYSHLPMNIYITDDGSTINHGVRIKVQSNYNPKFQKSELFTVVVDDLRVIGDTGEIKPKDLKKVLEFVEKYRQELVDIWNMELSVPELLDIVNKY